MRLRLASPEGRWLVAATVLASGMGFLDNSIVSLALPTIDRDLGAGVTGLQWVVNGYTLALASLVLIAGSLGDHLGRRRVFVLGVVIFGVASVACAAAPSIELLVAARIVQGVGGALLTPGSLAIISASIHPDDRGKAIGLWSGLSAASTAVGPLVGGTLVETVGWRSIFWINVPIVLAIVWITHRHVPESKGKPDRLDLVGAGLTVASLASLTYGLEGGRWWAVVLGVVLLVAFVLHQLRAPHAIVPMSLFANRVFSAANVSTFAIYAALGASSFLLVLELQYVAGFSALEAGLSSLPATVIMLLFSSKAGEWGDRVGPRVPMTLGPVVCAVGLLLYLRIGEGASFWLDVLPGTIVFGVGLTMLVAPLTSTVLAAAPDDLTGIASGVNNAVSRTAILLAVAAIPSIVGITGPDFAQPEVFDPGFRAGTLIAAGLQLTAAAVSAVLLRGSSVRRNA